MESALQEAIHTALSADAPLVAAVAGIYDDRPQVVDSSSVAAFPVVTHGDNIITQWPTDDWSGGSALVRVHVWSRYPGRKEAKDIVGLIRAALDRAALTITGYTALSLDFEQSFVDVDPDGETRHGVIEFRALICP